MPIYEYHCPACDAHFQHLARSFRAPTPPCPVCSNPDVEKMASVTYSGRRESVRREAFDARASAARDGGADPQTAARLLQEGGALLDEITPPGVDHGVFREIVERRAKGARDSDFDDLVAAMPLPPSPLESEAQSRVHAHGEHGSVGSHAHSHRHSRDLGWG